MNTEQLNKLSVLHKKIRDIEEDIKKTSFSSVKKALEEELDELHRQVDELVKK
ncbi:hypothetical protein [Paenibacillus elgii]|uniref:hypothetical protein n=1 Tax=Paenibacillus elgii TaxID=189691 RepID=UPI0013D123E2|nr:hypothetical protein [Paenibacillus elgii]